jgi:hypothetical protein
MATPRINFALKSFSTNTDRSNRLRRKLNNIDIIGAPTSFFKINGSTASIASNDITDNAFNPVISKIETFMARKDAANRRNSDQPTASRISFLSLRNIWTNQTQLPGVTNSSDGLISSEI